jgi:hypothetical protein
MGWRPDMHVVDCVGMYGLVMKRKNELGGRFFK